MQHQIAGLRGRNETTVMDTNLTLILLRKESITNENILVKRLSKTHV
jgi:hypothetical protein